VLRRKVHGRVQLTNSDRLFFVQLYRWYPSILKAITIIRPETLVRWHRAGFRRYWRWKSRCMGGRPPIRAGVRAFRHAAGLVPRKVLSKIRNPKRREAAQRLGVSNAEN